MKLVMVFDAESVGLHGETFAVGWVVIDLHAARWKILERRLVWCNPELAEGPWLGHEWVRENVPSFVVVDTFVTGHNKVEVSSPQAVRNTFWQAWSNLRDGRGEKGLLAADTAWPVEARFLLDCVRDARDEREWKGPYPLIDIATLRAVYELNPTLPPCPSKAPTVDHSRKHNPLWDATLSARDLHFFWRRSE